jgi:acetoin utilization deacetylase AcuC-like enzyme
MTTILYEHSVFLEHHVPSGHPERPDRLRALNALFEHENFRKLDRRQAPVANEDAVLLAHPEAHLREVMGMMPEEGLRQIEVDTHASPASLNAALTGIGGAMKGVDDVLTGAADNVFVASRPPGHHAEYQKVMGFCLFNNAAIAARHAQKVHGVERVAIIDFDVHHGNGTQDIFLNDPSVLYCSTHQMPLFPGTGAKTESGVGNIVNAPLSPNDGSAEFRDAVRSRVLPSLHNFRPDLVILSAGFDAHHRDPLAQINLVGDDFDWITGQLMDIAGKYADNRVVSVLEGGYDLEGLAESAGLHICRLMKG